MAKPKQWTTTYVSITFIIFGLLIVCNFEGLLTYPLKIISKWKF